MSSPLESPDFKNLYVGDENDDDATITREYFTPAPDGPPNVYKEPIPDQSVLVNPPILNRLIAGTDTIDPTWTQPTQILPVDEFRIQMMVKVISATLTDGVTLADNPNNLTAPVAGTFSKMGARITPGDGWVNLGPYTGALCASAAGSAAAVIFSWMAVTK
jgi:hypothetical protein